MSLSFSFGHFDFFLVHSPMLTNYTKVLRMGNGNCCCCIMQQQQQEEFFLATTITFQLGHFGHSCGVVCMEKKKMKKKNV